MGQEGEERSGEGPSGDSHSGEAVGVAKQRDAVCVEWLGLVSGHADSGACPAAATRALLKNHLVFLAAPPNRAPGPPSHHHPCIRVHGSPLLSV